MRPFFDKSGRFIDDGTRVYLGVPRTEAFFNRGLGCYTYGTRDAEKKAKQRGLRPIGDTPIEKVFPKPKDEVTPILVEGIKKIRSRS